jgi:hypothetical protein
MIIVLAVLISGGTFIHYWQYKTHPEIKAHWNTYSPTVSKYLTNKIDSITQEFKKGNISAENSLTLINIAKEQKAVNKSEYIRKKEVLKSKYEVFNFPSKRQFMFMFFWALGWVVSTIITPISIRAKSDEIKRACDQASFLLMSVSIFWLFWVFFNNIITQNNWWYVVMFIGISFISTHIILRTVKYYTSKQNKIKTLISFILRVEKNHIAELGAKALYAEINNKAMKTDQTTKENIENYEEDQLDTLEEILNLKK